MSTKVNLFKKILSPILLMSIYSFDPSKLLRFVIVLVAIALIIVVIFFTNKQHKEDTNLTNKSKLKDTSSTGNTIQDSKISDSKAPNIEVFIPTNKVISIEEFYNNKNDYTIDYKSKERILKVKSALPVYNEAAKLDVWDSCVTFVWIHVERISSLESSVTEVMKYSVDDWAKVRSKVWCFDDSLRLDFDHYQRRKDWVSDMFTKLFDERNGIFEKVDTSSPNYMPRSKSNIKAKSLVVYKFFGRVLVEAILQNVSVDVPLADYVYGYILGNALYMEDLYRMNQAAYNHYNEQIDLSVQSTDNSMHYWFSDIKPLGNFSDFDPQQSDDLVVKSNIKAYFALLVYSDYVWSIKKQLDAIKYEFLEYIPISILKDLNAAEFRRLVCE